MNIANTLASVQNAVSGGASANAPASGSSASGLGASGASATMQGAQIAGTGTDFNSFLKLITAQLKNQDPASPVDSSQFTQQMISFSSVQQQSQTNAALQQLLTAVQGMQIGSASAYVGRDVRASASQISLSGGNAQFGYTLSAPAASVQVTIADSTGQVVFSGQGTGQTGDNGVSWNGVNSFGGNQEPDGAYKIGVKALDASGNPVAATPYVQGRVNAASVENGQVMLSLGANAVPLSTVTSIAHLS
jgi:flagellar basal-body rod modification protein FlgD